MNLLVLNYSLKKFFSRAKILPPAHGYVCIFGLNTDFIQKVANLGMITVMHTTDSSNEVQIRPVPLALNGLSLEK